MSQANGTVPPKKKASGKRIALRVLLGVLIAAIVCVAVFAGLYFTRFQTMATIEKLSDYDDGYNLYSMDVKYDYDLDRVIDRGITDNQSMFNALASEALPYLPVNIEVPSFACSAFTLGTADGNTLMGRNYDFSIDTSSMLVYCDPDDGYKSVGFAALSNVKDNDPEASPSKRLAALTAPFICLDGMNEKGVSIAVLTLDSDPVNQNTGKQKISTSLAIRLVLDRAATTQEAVDLLSSYDMFASAGRDYHFYITDASGDGRAVEWDCDSETRELVATPVNAVTNFFALYPDRVQVGERNRYGHGKDRYEAILKVFDEQGGNPTYDTAWDALKAAAQDPKPGDVTSNTQWSIVYNDSDLTADIALRRNWDDVRHYDLESDTVE